ncbi:septum site-determining protein [Haematobacter missouriensis]|uniref:Aminotransferase class V-fold PLP-dependent enzyme n=1 Tax=Haematobacter missouriensis TaxID=366616 RepID=A0ABX3ZYS4_9RHOB|nr:aminotransferase class V-fold PLP-dependent enzyme [Haematobacter missouriensis]KFI34033.1 septum site-determining protein [Haematobacter missouriensis]OWJ78273.1 aminotransferase class V-fold PLP-dependent enzyme [Haematobacter missouriensis]
MSLGFGRHYLAIPGPSVMPDRVLNAMHVPAPNIYTGALVDTVDGIVADLRTLAHTKDNVAIYIANGHGAWEAANANVFSRGDRALSLATGRFGINWAAQAREMGVEIDMIDFGLRAPVDAQRVEEALRADTGHSYKAVLLTHVDTATSVRNDVQAVRQAMDAAGHPALLMVDCVASFACDPFEMDAWGVDVLVTASQKGLMTPPGLGILFFSDKAKQTTRGNDLRTPYWDWQPRAEPQEFYQHFYGTAPTHLLLGLAEALNMILREEGYEAVMQRHKTLARTVWAAFDAWSHGSEIALNIADPAFRGHSVTAARMGAPHGTALREWTEKNVGVTLGIGLGMAEPGDPLWHGFLRVAHMGHVNAHMTLGVLSVMEAGLRALDIPHGPGALDAAAQVIASSC